MPLTRKRFLDLAGRGALGAAAYSTFGFFGRAEAAQPPAENPCRGTRLSTRRFQYRGSAVGVGGRITDPPLGAIPAQAATALPFDGGTAEARAAGFSFYGIVSVDSAYSLVTGNPDLRIVDHTCQRVFRTVVTATLHGVDVDGVVRIDTVVASLESQQPEDGGELDIEPVGYFTNFRIRGQQIPLEPNPDLMRLGKWSDIDRFVRSSKHHARMPGASESDFSCSIFDDASIGAVVNGPPNVKEKEMSPGVKAYPGGRIHVDDFGDIYLGELIVEKEYRRFTMLRIELASPPTGSLAMGSVEGDGRLG